MSACLRNIGAAATCRLYLQEMTVLLCLQCGMVDDHLQGAQANEAVAVRDGVSVCGRHIRPSAVGSSLTSHEGDVCAQCRRTGRHHIARFVHSGSPLCIRHAADEVFPQDDMAAHQMAHDLYLQLHARGVRDSY